MVHLPIPYTTGTRATDKESHLLHAHIAEDNNPYWVMETLIDFKFLDLKAKAFNKSPTLSTILAQDRCPQLDQASRERLFSPLLYHVKEIYSHYVLEAFVSESHFNKLVNLDQLKYCVALSRQSMVSFSFLV